MLTRSAKAVARFAGRSILPMLADLEKHAKGLAIAGAVAVVLSTSINVIFEVLRPRPTLEARIAELTGALTSASRTISEIEGEVKSRQALVQRLQDDARTAEALARANRAQVEAVAQVLRREMDRDQTRAFWIDIAKNVFFAVFGAVVGLALSDWRQRRSAKEGIGS